MGGGGYNTVPELIEDLKSKSGYSRYPVVILHTLDINTYWELISELKNMVDEVIYLSNYCMDKDCGPSLWDVRSYIETLTKNNKKVMIVPLSEIIREWNYIEDIILFNYETNNNSKIYLPLFEISKDMLNKIINYDNSDRNERKIPIYEIKSCSSMDEKITIYSLNEKNFDNISQIFSIISNNKKFIVEEGFKGYLRLWESKKIKDAVIVLSTFLNTPKEGAVNIVPLENLKELIHKLYNINIPIKYNESEKNFWMECLKKCSEGWNELKLESTEEYIKKLEKWVDLSNFEKWLWFNLAKHKLISDTTYANTYIAQVLKNCNTYEDLENMIWMSIFDINPLNLSENILKERANLIDNIIGINAPPREFENKIDKITNPILKLKMLYGNNYDNKLNIVKCVGECLKNNVSPLEISKVLKIIYLDLYYYISVPFLKDEFTTKYIKNYIFAKLKNELTPELIQLNKKFSENNMLWNYSYRNEIIEYKNTDFKYVIDGLGIEWCGLIKSKFESDKKFSDNNYSIFIDIGKANLPTITESNEIDYNYFYDELDKYYHNPNYKYPNNIVDEIDKINNMLEKIFPKISQYSSILITADHGSTRFSGHIAERIKSPKNSEIKKNGRFAQSTEKPEDSDEYIIHEYENVYYAISKTYKIFEGGKRTNAESHGGATLEEILVPIITISSLHPTTKSISVNVLNCELPNYKPYLKIEIIPESDTATLRILNESIPGKKINNTMWGFNLKDLNLSAGEYTGTIELSCGYKSSITFKITKGYEEEEYF